MKARKIGLVFKTNNEDYALAYGVEQLPQFYDKGKLLVHLYYDEKLQIPKLDKPMLKKKTNLKFIRFN